MKQIIICEEVQIEREMLREMLRRYFAELGEEIRVWEYESGEEMLADAEEGRLKIDLLFLDIYMKGITGIEVARQVRRKGCRAAIVFLTDSPDFAMESYEVCSSGYLLKPFLKEQLEKVLKRIFQLDFKRRIALKTRHQYRYPYIDDIEYVESDKHSIIVHLTDGTKVEATEKLSDIEKRICDKRFLRCHQSYLINMDYIEDVKGDFILKGGEIVPIRVRGRKKVLDEYYHYFVKENERLFGGGNRLKEDIMIRINIRKVLSIIMNVNFNKVAYYAF